MQLAVVSMVFRGSLCSKKGKDGQVSRSLKVSKPMCTSAPATATKRLHVKILEPCTASSGEKSWCSCCAHRVAIIDPVGTVLQDMTEHVKTWNMGRTKLTLTMTDAGEAAFKKLQKTKVPAAAAPVEEEEHSMAEKDAAPMSADLAGWTARHFARGKRGEENVMKWLLTLPSAFEKTFGEELLDSEGKILIRHAGGVKQVLPWIEVATRAPLYFDTRIKGKALEYGAQVTWQLHRLVPSKDASVKDFRAKVQEFSKTVVQTTPPILPSFQ